MYARRESVCRLSCIRNESNISLIQPVHILTTIDNLSADQINNGFHVEICVYGETQQNKPLLSSITNSLRDTHSAKRFRNDFD